ncbi:hypothetical protein Droror1_Dr00026939 [Drosera rotundifolia]
MACLTNLKRRPKTYSFSKLETNFSSKPQRKVPVSSSPSSFVLKLRSRGSDLRSLRDGKGRGGCGGGDGGGRGQGVGAVRVSSEGGGTGGIYVRLRDLERGKGKLERKETRTSNVAAWYALDSS